MEQDFHQTSEKKSDFSKPYYSYKPRRQNSFMIASIISGVLAFAFCYFIFIALIAGGMSILFAILSKGSDTKMTSPAKAGVIISCLAIFLSIAITTAAFYLVFYDPVYHEQMNQIFLQMNGISFDDTIAELSKQFSLSFHY